MGYQFTSFGFLYLICLVLCECLHIENRAYESFTIKISEDVPEENCTIILENLQLSIQRASQFLFSALNGKAYLRSATVLLPTSWPDSCASANVLSSSGEKSDVTILRKSSNRGALWTQQSLGCGQPGDQIYISSESLLEFDNKLGRSLVKEFALYRYGVFEEQGYVNDPVYPICHFNDDKKRKVITSCTDLPLNDEGICENEDVPYNISAMVNPNTRSSIIFAPESPSVSMFCDSGNHDRLAPTKQNFICDRKSVLDVIMSHQDFSFENSSNSLSGYDIADTTTRISYKRQKLTRYVFVIENTKDMMQRESWYYMRLALHHWSVNQLPNNTELGLILTETKSTIACELFHPTWHLNHVAEDTDKFYSAIPYTPSDSIKPGCLSCGLKDAVDMLNSRTQLMGEANNIIVVISPGMENSEKIESILTEIKKSKIKIATINYPHIIRKNSLNLLADKTDGGSSYTVFEKKLNVESTLLSTYFELLNVLSDITRKYYSGKQSDLPMEIHRREIIDNGRSSITGSFVLNEEMGQPASFNFITHNTATPLFKSLRLISPSLKVFTSRSDRFLFFKTILLNVNISETGTWTYVVEPYSGNPQPHFLQVFATPKSSNLYLNARFWTHRNQPNSPLILLVEVKFGDTPVQGAKVEVTVKKTCNPCNQTHEGNDLSYKLDLYDNGSGDPDITKGDGIYTRYFSANEGGIGFYTFEVQITDNGNTAYRLTDSSNLQGKPCCGSFVPSKTVEPVPPFQRILPKQTIFISSEEILTSSQFPAGKIGDLKVSLKPKDLKATLSWTAPDMAGTAVSRYEIRYSYSPKDIAENFEINGIRWEGGQDALPLSPGSETSYNLDFSLAKELLNKPIYLAIKAYPKMSSDVPGTISNFVRVFVPSLPPLSTMVPIYDRNGSFWPNSNSIGANHLNPSITKTTKFGIEMILPIAIGFILLVFILIFYCYFCVVKKKEQTIIQKSSLKNVKSDKSSTNVTIIPNTLMHNPSQNSISGMIVQHNLEPSINHHNNEDEKRYSIVNQQEQQLIEELKQQRNMNHDYNNYNDNTSISIISNRTGHPLSPFNSWSASQLLHEHERRYSPLENILDEHTHPDMEGLSINGHDIDHMNWNEKQMMDQYQHKHIMTPPVPPLPLFNVNDYSSNYKIYGTHQPINHELYETMRRDSVDIFNHSIQGSMNSVNGSDKKRRNVTMV